MSSPKEKAEELVNRFMNIRPIKMSDYSVIYFPTAKQCALIAVDEIISVLNGFAYTPTQDYWQEVKREIEKL